MMRLLPLALLLAFFALPSLGADAVGDDALYDKVRIEIANDREVGGRSIEVKVTDGVVELTGKVKTEKLRNRAQKLAKKVKGVKSVVNRIQVVPV